MGDSSKAKLTGCLLGIFLCCVCMFVVLKELNSAINEKKKKRVCLQLCRGQESNVECYYGCLERGVE